MKNFATFLRSEHSDAPLASVLELPVDALLGVDQAARTALNSIGIATVFDLGASWIFEKAQNIANAGDFGSLPKRVDLTPADWLHRPVGQGALNELGSLPLRELRGLSNSDAAMLVSGLDVVTIRDFAHWPPHHNAYQMVSHASGATVDLVPEPGDELRPRLGEFPTERVYYDKLVMLHMTSPDGTAPLNGPVSLQPAVTTPLGFGTPAVGALLTYSQSWYAKGITLGHMLHSLALAPGEATRVAIVDWQRQTSALASENVSESERLDSATNHARAMSEVQNAVAEEMQEGSSISSGWAKSNSESSAESGSSGFLQSALGDSGSNSSTSQSAVTRSGAKSASWSSGSKSILAEMTQNINDRTEQHSNSVRNRRASAVREVSQSEHETVSTRIVANYNHMHALTVQYYEVVQVYSVETTLHRTTRCLFIPFAMPDLKDSDVINRFRGALIASALTPRVRDLLRNATASVILRPTLRTRVPVDRFDFENSVTAMEFAQPNRVVSASDSTTAAPIPATVPTPDRSERPFDLVWAADEIAIVSRELGQAVLRPGSDAIYLPADTVLRGISFTGVNLASVRLDRAGARPSVLQIPLGTGTVDVPSGTQLRDLRAISVARAADDTLHSGGMTLHCVHLGRPFATPTIPLRMLPGIQMQSVVKFETDGLDRERELKDHLEANVIYYSQAILGALDTATLVMLLSRSTWNGKPLTEQVEPDVLAISGNYVILRAPVDLDEDSGIAQEGRNKLWRDILDDKGLTAPLSDFRSVSIPTAGVFAEAVLGRSNSAEKLDITRFWNWQDSPIPLQPPEISPISTGTRSQPENLRPGQLGPPLLNIVNPTSLPDPAGLSASISALATSNMFRDMSGLSGTQAVVEAALRETLAAAGEAGQLASTNLLTEAQKVVATGRIASDIFKTAMGVPPVGSADSVSADGAKINHGRDLDDRAKATEPSDGSVGMDAAAIGGASADGPNFTGSESVARGSATRGVTSREEAYADRSALGFSPEAVKDVVTSISQIHPVFAATGSGSDTGLGVSTTLTQAYDYVLDDKNPSRRRFKKLALDAATKFSLNPGLLVVNLLRETGYTDYLRNEKTSSFLIGTDDYFEKRADISAKVPQEVDVGWDRAQTPTDSTNETGRTVKSIQFDSGPDGLLASAAYLKHGEEVLRLEAAALAADFDTFNADLRFALTRLAFHAGLGRAKRNMADFITNGTDVLIRSASATSGPQRKATISAAQAIHISTTIFGVIP